MNADVEQTARTAMTTVALEMEETIAARVNRK